MHFEIHRASHDYILGLLNMTESGDFCLVLRQGLQESTVQDIEHFTLSTAVTNNHTFIVKVQYERTNFMLRNILVNQFYIAIQNVPNFGLLENFTLFP